MLSDADLARFRERLVALNAELRAAVRQGSAADTSIAVDNAIGRLTRMEAIQAQAMAAAGRQRLRERLPRIAAALARIEEGTYGRCVRCAGEIPLGRLEIAPESALCVACAARGR
ncbi:MAG: TraR/DksA family transcriptional regulator [Rubricoccaceae bacterium]